MIQTKKWYEGLEGKDIVLEMSRIYHICIACAIQGHIKESEKYFDEFTQKFHEVIPAIVDTKAEYYNYNKSVYQTWQKVHDDLLSIKRSLEFDLKENLK